MPISEDPFAVLDVARDATLEEIRAAYRRAAKRAHPDQGGSSEAFHRIQQAAETLLADLARQSLSGRGASYRGGDRTSAAGRWQDVADDLKARWGLLLDPTIVFAPTRIGLSPFSTATLLNQPAHTWLTGMVGPRGEAWDFHITGDQTRMFFRRADDARMFKMRFS